MGVILLAMFAALFVGLAVLWIIGALLLFGTAVTHAGAAMDRGGQPAPQANRPH